MFWHTKGKVVCEKQLALRTVSLLLGSLEDTEEEVDEGEPVDTDEPSYRVRLLTHIHCSAMGKITWKQCQLLGACL